MLNNTDLARFWANVDKTDTCWLWTASLEGWGYGRMLIRGKRMSAHRWSWLIAGRELEDGFVLDHTCHVRHCVNPDHLRQVTQKQNCENLGQLPPLNTSGARGVSWRKDRKKWQVRVTHNRVERTLGYYADFDEAAEVALAERLRLFTCNDLDRVNA